VGCLAGRARRPAAQAGEQGCRLNETA
jgi:hypothetical protein